MEDAPIIDVDAPVFYVPSMSIVADEYWKSGTLLYLRKKYHLPVEALIFLANA